MICGRKRPPTMNLASMLRKIVLPDNMAAQLFPQIFLGADTKICGKNVLGGLAILCVRNGALNARKIVPHYLADPGILYVKPQVDGSSVRGTRCVLPRSSWSVGTRQQAWLQLRAADFAQPGSRDSMHRRTQT